MIRKRLKTLGQAAIVVLGPILFFDAFVAGMAWYFRIPWYDFLAPALTRFRLGYLVLCAGSYGLGRVAATHPIFNTPYRRWLMTTPWRRGLPLPLGEVSLTTGDAVWLGVLVAVAAL
jgi:hypothetical protein